MKAKNFFVCICLAMLLGACTDVQLSATPAKRSFTAKEAVVINLRLNNSTSSVQKLSDRVDGTIKVVSITRDGKVVPMRTVVSRYDSNLEYILDQSLSPLKPGESITLRWQSVEDKVLRGQSLETVELRSAVQPETTYSLVGVPGNYHLVFFYQYPATAAAAYRKATNTVVLDFSVVP